MTQTDAQERIWAYVGSEFGGIPSWEWGLAYLTPDMEDDDWPDPVEYTRTDTIQATVDAAVAAERERCLDIARSMLPKDHGEIVDAGRDYCEGVRDVCAAIRKGGK